MERAAQRSWTAPGRLELLARHVDGPAALELSWSNLMGARIPVARADRGPGPAAPLGARRQLGDGAARPRLRARRRAAAARYAVAQRAETELAAELARAARRLRALRDRWIPQHEEALARLDLALDESQREQAARVRWLIRRGTAARS